MRAPRTLAALATIGGLLAVGSASEAFEATPAQGTGAAVRANVTITGAPLRGVPPVQRGFVGLSIEYPAVAHYTGSDPRRPDRVFEQLVRGLSPGAAPVLRIGGDSTDSTWWPAPGAVRPLGARYTLTPSWMAGTRAVVRDLGARVIAGVNLEAHRPRLAIAEARALLGGIGSHSVDAIEIGNEPSNYPRFPWYRFGGHAVYARSSAYSFTDFTHEFSAIRRGLPGVPLAGPALSGYGWLVHLGQFLSAEPTVTTATFHRYPLNRCFAGPGSPMQATLSNLLGPFASRGFLAPARPYVALAHARGRRFRLDEFNSVSCAGKLGLSDRFASALWAVDALFEVARYGIDGVNIHTFPGVPYAPFDVSHTAGTWSAVVHPEYYGLLMFARAAPAGARLLAVSGRPARRRADLGDADHQRDRSRRRHQQERRQIRRRNDPPSRRPQSGAPRAVGRARSIGGRRCHSRRPAIREPHTDRDAPRAGGHRDRPAPRRALPRRAAAGQRRDADAPRVQVIVRFVGNRSR